MEFYGNKIWNDATDNSKKSYYVMQQSVFDEVSQRLEANGLNYYAYSHNGTVKMAVNMGDIVYFQDAVGKQLLGSMDSVGSAKSNAPSPIIGTVAYKDIADKRFFSHEIDTVLKVADRLRLENIPFSGRVYEDHATLTVSPADEKKMYEIYNDLINQRQLHQHKLSQSMIVGNTPVKSIANRSYFTTSMTPEQFLKIKPEIDRSGIAYSGIVKIDHTIITVDAADHAAFQDLVDSISAREQIHRELEQEQYSEHQIALLADLIDLYAVHGRDDLITTPFEPYYTDEQLLDMAERAKIYVMQSQLEKVLDKNGVLQDILQCKKELQKQYDFQEALKDFHFSDEQRAALWEIQQQGMYVNSLLSTIHEDYTAAEIRQLGIAMLSADMDAVQAVLDAHQQQDQSLEYNVQEVSDASVTHDLSQLSEDLQRDIPLEAVMPLGDPEPADTDTYALYRLKDMEQNVRMRFLNYEGMLKYYGGVESRNYECIYSAHAEPDDTPDRIYDRFNIDHPTDFTGNSLSVGDIIVYQRGEQKQALFVDSVGFKELPDFFLERQPEPGKDLFELPFSDREKSIIGNTPYRYISGKTYHKMERQKALRMAEQLAEKDIPFSARLREETATITIPAIHDSVFLDMLEASEPVPDLNRLEDAFVRHAVNTIQDNVTVRNSHQNSGQDVFTLDVHHAADRLVTDIMSQAGMVDGYSLSELSPFLNGLQDTIVHDRVYDRITSEVDGVLRNLEAARQTAEPEKEQPEIQAESASDLRVGDHIQTADQRKWAVTRLDGDFSISLQNLDPTDNQSVRGVYGHWKNKLEYHRIPGSGIPTPSKTKRTKQITPTLERQLSLDAAEKPSEGSASVEHEEKPSAMRLNPEHLPTVKVEWSEHPEIQDGKIYSVAEFDTLMKRLDNEWVEKRQQEITTYGDDMNAIYGAYERGEIDGVHMGYAKTKFTLHMPDGATYSERQDIGDGDGGMIDFLRQYTAYANIVPILEQAAAIDRTEKDLEKSAATEPAQNTPFTFTEDTLSEGGAKARFQKNIDAIHTLRSLQAGQRQPIPEEQAELAQYVGWGGLPQAFDPDNTRWAEEYQKLKKLLDPKDYENARASTLNAHYTSPTVINAIYEGLQNMGFQGGNVLEPAMGIGNFFGAMPENMRSHSNLYGVELDGITGQIAQMLYPDANIQVKGFEQTDFRNNSFDVAVGNVPFGSYKVPDKEYDAQNFMIHDYFLAKSLDKVKEGGIVAVVTSTGTLDKRNSAAREYLAQRADLLGAIRLPNNAFKANAGTEVTTDILFLQKRSEPPVERPSWVDLGQTANGLPVNQYFADHPDMVLGTIVEGNKLYGGTHGTNTMCIPLEGADLKKQLHKAISKIHGQIHTAPSLDNVREEAEVSGLQPFTYTLEDQKLLFRAGSEVRTFSGSETERRRILGMIQLRDTTRELLQAQMDNAPDERIIQLQRQLNEQYDTFRMKYGLIHGSANKRLFADDAGWGLICSLEKEYTKNKLIQKSDIFTHRTIRPPKKIEHVATAQDALAVSIQERAAVDLPFMEQISGLESKQLISELREKIFPVPGSAMAPNQPPAYVIADEYLSGNIREKLDQAKEAAQTDSRFAGNVSALEKVMPEPLKAGDIDVQLGATWIPAKYVQKFMYETFKTPLDWQESAYSSGIQISYLKAANQWLISGRQPLIIPADVERLYGTKEMSPYRLLETALNLKDPKVYMTVRNPGDIERRVLDLDATRLARQKMQKIKAAFSQWIFQDPDRREDLVQIYNTAFNSIRPREYDGSHLEFPGMNVNIQLHAHQKNAIAHALYGGNTLFAHSVGAGKTFEMIATAMEGKRLGLCHKSMFVVPKHLTEQVGEDFHRLYPNANVLVATSKDFKAENRRELMAKIATGNYDAVVISHSQFGLLPVSRERQESMIREQIQEVVNSITQLKHEDGDRIQIKAMERTKHVLESNLRKLLDMPKDKFNVTFEQLGIDKLFVDEAHEFKNLFSPTKLTNVAGLSSSASRKATDLYTKCRYLDEVTGGKGVVFATGTPISNTITELHTMMRYLQHDTLKKCGIEAFDSWVSTFGKPETAYELSPAGNKWRQKTRIAKYSNLPELVSMFKQCADIKTPDILNLDVPECRLHVIETEATDFQKELVAELSDRADIVQAGGVDPSEDNMLRITGDGRKVGLDPRLIDPEFEDDPNTKLNQCVRNVFRIWEESKPDLAAQLIFCDLGVPHGKSAALDAAEQNAEHSVSDQDSLEESGSFCVYEDIRNKLMQLGIPKEEIAFIHDAGTEAQKAALFEKVRSGKVRVLLGSTSKLGTGTNVQDRLIATHDLDVPWRPSDLDQRRGRMVRQGNMYKQVDLYRYVTKGTFDAYSYQTLENKQKFISQIITSKTPARSCEDVDQAALSYAEVKALCTGDERIKEKLMLDNEVKELQLMRSEYNNQHYEMEDRIRQYPERSASLKARLEALQQDVTQVHALSSVEGAMPDFCITLGGNQYTDMKEACVALDEQLDKLEEHTGTDIEIGSIYGFPLTVRKDEYMEYPQLAMHGALLHEVNVSKSARFTLRNIEAVVVDMSQQLEFLKCGVAQLDLDYQDALEHVHQPFQREQELQDKSERLSTLNEQLQAAAKAAVANRTGKHQPYYFSRSKRQNIASNHRPETPVTTREKSERSQNHGTECK